MTKQQYINAYWPAAQEACKGTPIFPILALAESAVESAWGGSQLAMAANNLFGVKAYPKLWTGRTKVFHTKEYTPDGRPYYVDAPFKAYDSPADSFRDYVKTVEGHRYQATGTLTATTPEEQILDIAAGGYSTSKTYAQLITEVMQGLKQLITA